MQGPDCFILFGVRTNDQVFMRFDIFEDLDQDDMLTLRRVFQKRHVCEHNQGIISDRYTRMVPEDSRLLGTQVKLSLSELQQAAELLRLVLDKLSRALGR